MQWDSCATLEQSSWAPTLSATPFLCTCPLWLTPEPATNSSSNNNLMAITRLVESQIALGAGACTQRCQTSGKEALNSSLILASSTAKVRATKLTGDLQPSSASISTKSRTTTMTASLAPGTQLNRSSFWLQCSA